MFWFSVLVALVALAVAGWAVYLAGLALVTAGVAVAELKAHRIEHATDVEATQTTALRQLGDQVAERTEAIRAATARIEALKRKRLH